MEHIVSFLPSQTPDCDRFFVEMAGITYPDPTYGIDREQSPIYCLEYIINGQGDVQCGEQSFHVTAGDVYLLPQGGHHIYHASKDDPFEKIWVNFSGSLCDALYHQYQLDTHCHYPHQPLLPLFRMLLKVCEQNGNNMQYIISQCTLLIHEIFLHLAAPPSQDISVQHSYAQKAKDYIDLNISTDLNMTKVASHIGLSVSQLNRSFSAEYGMSPYRYYTANRIRLACMMLRNTSMQIKEISARLHFSDENYFSAAFKKQVGLSPKQYRASPPLEIRKP